MSIINLASTYTEISPSGTGLKLFCRCGQDFRSIQTPNIEIWSHNKYSTITGIHFEDTPLKINDCTDQIEHILAELLTPSPVQPKTFQMGPNVSAKKRVVVYPKPYKEAVMKNGYNQMFGSKEGNRNTTHNGVIFNKASLLPSGILTSTDIGHLSGIAISKGLRPSDVARTERSAVEAGSKKASHITILNPEFHKMPFANTSHREIALLKFASLHDSRYFQGKKWASQEKYEKEGFIVTTMFQNWTANKANVTQQTVSNWWKKLSESGLVKMVGIEDSVMPDGQVQEARIIALGEISQDTGQYFYYLNSLDPLEIQPKILGLLMYMQHNSDYNKNFLCNQQQLANIFGVTQFAISKWLKALVKESCIVKVKQTKSGTIFSVGEAKFFFNLGC